MAYTIYARMKKMGKQKKETLIPVAFKLPGKPDTVRELLTELVQLLVRQYNERKDNGQLLPWLTEEEIDAQAAEGKVSFGTRGGNDADLKAAKENAVQCFEDGIYRIFFGEEELIKLEQQIPWSDEEKPVFTFIRLTMLSGW